MYCFRANTASLEGLGGKISVLIDYSMTDNGVLDFQLKEKGPYYLPSTTFDFSIQI